MPSKRKSTCSAAEATAKRRTRLAQKPESEHETRIDDGDVGVSSKSSDSVTEVNKHQASSGMAAGSGKKLAVLEDKRGGDNEEPEARFIGDPIPDKEARQRWPKRYEDKVNLKWEVKILDFIHVEGM